MEYPCIHVSMEYLFFPENVLKIPPSIHPLNPPYSGHLGVGNRLTVASREGKGTVVFLSAPRRFRHEKCTQICGDYHGAFVLIFQTSPNSERTSLQQKAGILLPSGNQTWRAGIPIYTWKKSNGKYGKSINIIYSWWMFHCHV